jgi:hypothetical protein
MKYIFFFTFLFAAKAAHCQSQPACSIYGGVGTPMPGKLELFPGLFSDHPSKVVHSANNIPNVHIGTMYFINPKLSMYINLHLQVCDKIEYFDYQPGLLFGHAAYTKFTYQQEQAIGFGLQKKFDNQNKMINYEGIFGLSVGTRKNKVTIQKENDMRIQIELNPFIIPTIYLHTTYGKQLKGFANIGYGAAGLLCAGLRYDFAKPKTP